MVKLSWELNLNWNSWRLSSETGICYNWTFTMLGRHLEIDGMPKMKSKS